MSADVIALESRRLNRDLRLSTIGTETDRDGSTWLRLRDGAGRVIKEQRQDGGEPPRPGPGM